MAKTYTGFACAENMAKLAMQHGNARSPRAPLVQNIGLPAFATFDRNFGN
jgi:hypothetical protein